MLCSCIKLTAGHLHPPFETANFHLNLAVLYPAVLITMAQDQIGTGNVDVFDGPSQQALAILKPLGVLTFAVLNFFQQFRERRRDVAHFGSLSGLACALWLLVAASQNVAMSRRQSCSNIVFPPG
jgi:hypothetical protein